MPPTPTRSLGGRARLIAVATVLALTAATPSALGDQLAPDGLAGPQGTDPVPAGTPSLGAHGDHFGEDPTPAGEPFVLETDAERVEPAAVPAEPLAWEGPAPDPGDVPAEWLVETPAEQVTPSTPEQLMTADTGYLAQYGPVSTGTAGDTTAAAGDTTAAGEPEAIAPQAVPAPPTKALPATLDAAPGWQYTYSCDPNNKPGMLQFAALVSAHYNRPNYFTWRHCIAGDNSQHYEGRAFDWGMDAFNPDDKAIGDAVAQWITANNGEIARRFGIMSVIWNRRSWYLYDPGAWRDYTGPSPHTDHLHISFTWDGAMGRTSWWTGTPVTVVDHGTCRVYAGQYAPRYTGRRTTACPTTLPLPPVVPQPVVLPQARNDYVRTAQQFLGFTGADVDGIFGPMTLAALLQYQAAASLPVTGVLDKATWANMLGLGSGEIWVDRVQGSNRFATAAALAAKAPVGQPAYITAGADFPDALAASARAGIEGAPVLLTHASALPPQTQTALTRLRPSQIFVVGGSASVSPEVLQELGGYTTGTVTRLAGANRYATAGQVARRWGTNVPVVYVAAGTTYPDAMTGATRAAYMNGPLLLTKPTSIPPETVSAMRAINPARVVVLGGTQSVSAEVAQQLAALTTTGNLQRVSGGDRYATAAALAAYWPADQVRAFVTTGTDFPDALAGSARAGTLGAPMLLVRPDGIPDSTLAVLKALRPRSIVVVGGRTSVSPAVVQQLARINLP